MKSWSQYYERRTNFENHVAAPHIRRLLGCIVQAWEGGDVLEVGAGTGFLSIWLSRIGIPVTALDNDPDLVQSGHAANNALGGQAEFLEGDAFSLSTIFPGRQFEIIFHQGVMEHFNDSDIRRLIQEQLGCAKKVLFTVPSMFYPRQDFGDERLMTLEQWQDILAPLGNIVDHAEYHGHQAGGKEELFLSLSSAQSVQKSLDAVIPRVQPAIPDVEWHSDFLHHSGYAHHARAVLLGMDRAGIDVTARLILPSPVLEGDYSANTWERLVRMLNRPSPRSGVCIIHHPPVTPKGDNVFARKVRENPGFRHYIGSTIFETDRIPSDWVPVCNTMDEIWVQNQFNYETFTGSGVDEKLLHIVPSGIDPAEFDPSRVAPLVLHGGRRFNFISIFEWTKRKGWDILLNAYLKEFDYREDVGLTLIVYRGSGTDKGDKETAAQKATQYIMGELGVDIDRKPFLNVIETVFPNYMMPRLYKAADAFVLPTRGEGWGIPFMEAMTMGLPVIGTRWGGNLEFMTDANSYLIDIEGLEEAEPDQVKDNPLYAGHRWAAPSVESTRRLMREVFEHRDQAKARGLFARQDIMDHWTIDHAGRKIAARLEEIQTEYDRRRTRTLKKPPVIERTLVWEGPLSDDSGFAEGGRNIVLGLNQSQRTRVAVRDVRWNTRIVPLIREKREMLDRLGRHTPEGRLVHVSHIFPEHFTKDSAAVLNVGRTLFETDRIPENWVAPCNAMDEIWVPTAFNVKTFTDSGVDAAKLHVIHESIDAGMYDPYIAPLYVHGRRGFNFLAVFDWSLRKGWDVLLQAFVEEFSLADDATLMLRTYSSLGLTTASIQQQILDHIHRFKTTNLPDIMLIDRMLSDRELIQLYRASQAFVLPSRCEGWGRAHMEAMAMGLPVIGTNWSGNLEFMTLDNSILLDAEVVEVPEAGFREVPVYRGHQWAEPSVEQLKSSMRHLYEDREAAVALGRQARQDIVQRFNWSRITEQIDQRLDMVLSVQTIATREEKPVQQDKKSARKTVLQPEPVTVKSIAVREVEPALLEEISSKPPVLQSEPVTVQSIAVREVEPAVPEEESSKPPVLQPEPVAVKKSMQIHGKPVVVWEGAQFTRHSLALVNREQCLELLLQDACTLHILPREQQDFGIEEDVERFVRLQDRFTDQAPDQCDIWVRHAWPPDFNRPDCRAFVMIQPWEFGRVPKAWIEPINSNVDELWVPSQYVRECFIASGVNPDKVCVIPNGVALDLFSEDVTPLKLATQKKFRFLFVGGTIWRKGVDALLEAYGNSFTAADDVCLVIKDMGQDTFYRGMGADAKIRDFQSRPKAPEILYLKDPLNQFEMPALYAACQALVHPYRGEGFGLPVAEALAMGLPVIMTKGGACDEICPAEYLYPVSASVARVNLEFELAGQGWVLDPDIDSLAGQMQAVWRNQPEARMKSAKARDHVRTHFGWRHAAALVKERIEAMQQPPAAVQSETGSIEGMRAQARQEAGAQQFVQAARTYARLVEVSTDDVSLLHEYGSVLSQTGDTTKAEQVLQRAAHLDDCSNVSLNLLGCFYYQINRMDQAEQAFRKVLTHDEGDIDALNNLVQLSFEKQQYAETLRFARVLVKQTPDDVNVLRLMASSCFHLQEPAVAQKLLLRARALAPDNAEIDADLVVVNKKLEETPAAHKQE